MPEGNKNFFNRGKELHPSIINPQVKVYSTAGSVTKIEKIVNGATFEKTLDLTSEPMTITPWSKA